MSGATGENVAHAPCGRCPTCDSALADPKSGWHWNALECGDPWHPAKAAEDRARVQPGIPSVDRLLELIDLALYDPIGITVLGWADNTVEVLAKQGLAGPLSFEVGPAVQRSHEDEVLIVAVRPPHPDEMSLEEVLRG